MQLRASAPCSVVKRRYPYFLLALVGIAREIPALDDNRGLLNLGCLLRESAAVITNGAGCLTLQEAGHTGFIASYLNFHNLGKSCHLHYSNTIHGINQSFSSLRTHARGVGIRLTLCESTSRFRKLDASAEHVFVRSRMTKRSRNRDCTSMILARTRTTSCNFTFFCNH